jgi:hypothetical protein
VPHNPPGIDEAATLLVSELGRIRAASLILDQYIRQLRRDKASSDRSLYRPGYNGEPGWATSVLAFNKLLASEDSAGHDARGAARPGGGSPSLPGLIREIVESSGRILKELGARAGEPGQATDVHVMVRVLESLLNSLTRILPLYNQFVRYVIGLYSIPVAILRDSYKLEGGDTVSLDVGGHELGVEVEYIVEYTARRGLSIVGAVRGSLPHELARLVHLAYGVFSVSGLGAFFKGVVDELAVYRDHMWLLLEKRAPQGYVSSVRALAESLSPFCVFCPCGGEPFIASLRDERYGSIYSRARCGYLDLSGSTVSINGEHVVEYGELVTNIAPLLSVGLAQVRDSGGRRVLAVLGPRRARGGSAYSQA